MLREQAGPHLIVLVAVAVMGAVMASPLEGHRGQPRGDNSLLDRAVEVEALLDTSFPRIPKYAPPKLAKAPKPLPATPRAPVTKKKKPAKGKIQKANKKVQYAKESEAKEIRKPVPQLPKQTDAAKDAFKVADPMREVNKGLKKANGYGAVGKKALTAPLIGKADKANVKADKLKQLVKNAHEMAAKNAEIRKVLKAKRPDYKELRRKVEEKNAEIARLEAKVTAQATTISEQAALNSPVGQAARNAAAAAGAQSKNAISLAAAVVGALKSKNAAKQDTAITAGLVAAAGALESGGDTHKAVSLAKKQTTENGGNTESAVVAAGVVVGDIKYEKKPNGAAAAAAAAEATQVQGGDAIAQGKAAAMTIQRAADTPVQAGAAA